MFLFSDILLLTKPKKKNRCDVEALIKLKKLTVTPYGSTADRITRVSSCPRDDRHLFKLSAPDEGEIWIHSENKCTLPHQPRRVLTGPASWLQLLHTSIKKLSAPPSEIDDLRSMSLHPASLHLQLRKKST